MCEGKVVLKECSLGRHTWTLNRTKLYLEIKETVMPDATQYDLGDDFNELSQSEKILRLKTHLGAAHLRLEGANGRLELKEKMIKELEDKIEDMKRVDKIEVGSTVMIQAVVTEIDKNNLNEYYWISPIDGGVHSFWVHRDVPVLVEYREDKECKVTNDTMENLKKKLEG